MRLYDLLIGSFLYSFAHSYGMSYTLGVHKRPRIKTGAIQHDYQKPNLYWGSVYTVGAGKNVTLELDTGSDDLILNTAIYKPSSYSRVRPHDHFTITYEGINRAGQGTETIRGNIVQDIVGDGVLTIYNQTFGNATYYKYKGIKPEKGATAGYDGIIGWEGARQSDFTPAPGSWFYSLCKQRLISQCRFALALGTKHKGKQVIGKVDHSLFKNRLTFAPLHGVWTTRADITLDNKIFIKNQTIIMDVGTTNMQAPSDAARQIFKKLGFPYKRIATGPPFNAGQQKLYFVDATFPCNKPPLLGLSIPAEFDLQTSTSTYMSKKPKIYNMLKSEWDLKNHGNNNCSAILSGTNALTNKQRGTTAWLVGQPFFQGHYIDMHIDKGIGYADLVNIETGDPC